MITEGLGNYTSLNEDWKSAFAMKKQGREQSGELKSFKELVDLIRSGDFTGKNAKRPVFSMQYSRDMSGNLLFRPAGQKKEEDMDWRDMPDEEWNRLLEGYDKYLEEVNTGEGMKMPRWLKGYVTYVIPCMILIILFMGLR